MANLKSALLGLLSLLASSNCQRIIEVQTRTMSSEGADMNEQQGQIDLEFNRSIGGK
jgi:ubiquitin-protein ligase